MQFTRDTAEESRFYEKLSAFMDSERRVNGKGEYHVSDLLSPRKCYFGRVTPLPLTKKQLGFFLAGKAHHLIAEVVLEGTAEKQIVLHVNEGLNKIVGTPDTQRPHPIEFKTSRKWSIPSEPPAHYVDQLLMYCAMAGSSIGTIVVFFLTPGRTWDGKTSSSPEIICWKVEFTPEDLAQGVEWLAKNSAMLDEAFEIHDHSLLPLCEPWMCGGKYKGKISVECPYYETCQPEGRYPENRLGS